jgi:Flp pilus assembly protein TadG
MHLMSKRISALSACRRGAAALEFALVAPVLVLLTFGTVEFAFMLYDLHRYGNAARNAARAAAIFPPVASLSNLSTTPVVCTSSGGLSCSGGALINAASFDEIVAAAEAEVPELTAANIRVTYKPSGIVITAPTALTSTPAITVELVGLQRRSMFLASWVASVPGIFSYGTFASTTIGSTVVN